MSIPTILQWSCQIIWSYATLLIPEDWGESPSRPFNSDGFRDDGECLDYDLQKKHTQKRHPCQQCEEIYLVFIIRGKE